MVSQPSTGHAPAGAARANPEDVLGRLLELRHELLGAEDDEAASVGAAHEAWRASAANLVHYLALRRHDLRAVQRDLAALGLSSLGRSESHVLANLDAVLDALHRITGRAWDSGTVPPRLAPDFDAGAEILARHTEALLGPAPPARSVRILVTLPSEAADDVVLLRDLVAGGMDCARINCAHDGPEVWSRMIANLRRVERECGRTCRVLMDLGGPKLRTGAFAPRLKALKWKPERDPLGRPMSPARIWLHAGGTSANAPAPASASVPVGAAWLASLRDGDHVTLDDTRGATRVLTVGRCVPGGAWAECAQTGYVTAGTRLMNERGGADPRETEVGPLPERAGHVTVVPGDMLVVTEPQVPGRPAERDASGGCVALASVPCTLPGVLADVREGERICFDDGRVGGVVRGAEPGRLLVEITEADAEGDKIRADKGINLPDTRISLPALTAKDLDDLAFVAHHADAVSFSFVRDPADVDALAARLAELGRPGLGIVLKIETRQAFERLPELLLTAMRSGGVGVMIARGDLAVECGWERLAEVQEEILWFCEAAHVPAIWATQVLENLAKDGRPSRAEITDAAMGERAECVMLNKGPHVVAAVRMLDDILRRMAAHQCKKSPTFRPLRLARDFAVRADGARRTAR